MSEYIFPEIPGYEIERVIGQGGMGIIYLAVQIGLDREVALKVTLPALAELDPSFTKRFVQEAKSTATLKHPNIITIYDAGEFENSSYMAMEYIPSGTLLELNKSSLGQDDICQLFIGIAKGLGAAHKAGFVHRDVKPDNILIDPEGRPIVADFGIVKSLNTTAQQTLTRSGSTVGTPEYMSPEQIQAHEIDGRSDLYSLGIMLYKFLEGNVPFKDETPSAIYIKHVTNKPLPLSKKNKVFQPVISRLLQKDPYDRYKDAEALIVHFKAILNKKESEVTQQLPKFRPEVTQVNNEINDTVNLLLTPAVREIHLDLIKKNKSMKYLTLIIFMVLLMSGYFFYTEFYEIKNTKPDITSSVSKEKNTTHNDSINEL